MRARTRARLASCPHPPLHGNGVDLKRVPPKSRPTATAPGSILGLIPRWKRPARTPPSTFLFLPIHLSNSPEPRGFLISPNWPESRRSHRPRLQIGGLSPLSVRSFAGASSRRAAARRWWLYRGRPRTLSTMAFADFLNFCEILNRAGGLQSQIEPRGRRHPLHRAKVAKCRTVATIFTPL
jgi:hypothetical protein